MAQAKPAKLVTRTLELKVVKGPHNGTPEYQSPDPVTGVMVGGQLAYIRAAMRFKRFVAPWGRRAGKTTCRPFLWFEEAKLTAGRYTAAFVTVNHVKAYEAWKFAFAQFGGLVKDGGVIVEAVGEPESQNRYLDIIPNNGVLEGAAQWIRDCPVLGPKLRANVGKNTGSRIYFLSGQYPTVTAVQGFPFPFDRISIDEAQQIHPGVTKIVNPMLMDSGGHLDVSGIADVDEIGNDWFSSYFERASEPGRAHRWKSLNFPTYCNPNLDKEATEEVESDLLTDDDYQQYIWARFISGSGAVFKNLDAVLVLRPRWSRTAPAHRDLPTWANTLLTRSPSNLLSMWVYEDAPKVGHNYAMTVDFAGRTRSRDSTVISVFDMTENAQVCLIKILDMQSPDQLHWIEGVKDHYGAHEIYGDETPEGAALMGYLRERYRTGVIGVKFNSSNKAEHVKRAQFLFEMAEVRLIDCPYQRGEFKDFRRITSESKDGKDGPVSYSHPPNKHDDAVAAFLQIAPAMVYGRRAMETQEPPKPDLIDKDGLLDLSAVNSDIADDLEEGEDAVRVRVPRR